MAMVPDHVKKEYDEWQALAGAAEEAEAQAIEEERKREKDRRKRLI